MILVDEKKSGLGFGTLGIIIGIFVVVLTIVWVTIVNLADNDNPNEITWV